MYYVIGLDGGGTKTEALALNYAGDIVARYEGRATNPHSVTFPVAERNLMEILNYFYHQPLFQNMPCRAICFGLAGGGAEEVQQHFAALIVQYAVEKQQPPAKVIMKNDAEIALTAGLNRSCGILVIAGTGSIVYGITAEGVSYRTGGWGHILGDQGSGYAIGLQTLQAVMQSYDGVLQHTELIPMIKDKLSLTHTTDLKSYIYQPHIQKQHIAAFAELCIKTAKQGDAVALHIIRRAAAELAVLVQTLRAKDKQLDDLPIALTGSIFNHCELFREHFISQVRLYAPGADIRLSAQPAAYGAARIALDSLGRLDSADSLDSLDSVDSAERLDSAGSLDSLESVDCLDSLDSK